MAKDKDRKRIEDEAGVGPDPRTARHLVPLKELPRFRIASSDPDIRGWTVFTSNGREVGHVDDLLVDPTIDEAVMLDIDLSGSDRHTLAPIRAAWIDRENERVILDGAELAAGSDLPSLGRTAPSEEELRRFGDRYASTWGDRAIERDRDYRIHHADEELRLARRGDDAQARAPGSEVVVERRLVSPDEPSWAAASAAGDVDHDVRYPDETRTAPGDRRLVEEVVVRRRYVDATELEEERRAEERRAREARDASPPPDESADTSK